MPDLTNNNDDTMECPRELRSDFSLRPLRKANAANYYTEPEVKNSSEREEPISYMTKARKMNELEKLAVEVREFTDEINGEIRYLRNHVCRLCP